MVDAGASMYTNAEDVECAWLFSNFNWPILAKAAFESREGDDCMDDDDDDSKDVKGRYDCDDSMDDNAGDGIDDRYDCGDYGDTSDGNCRSDNDENDDEYYKNCSHGDNGYYGKGDFRCGIGNDEEYGDEIGNSSGDHYRTEDDDSEIDGRHGDNTNNTKHQKNFKNFKSLVSINASQAGVIIDEPAPCAKNHFVSTLSSLQSFTRRAPPLLSKSTSTSPSSLSLSSLSSSVLPSLLSLPTLSQSLPQAKSIPFAPRKTSHCNKSAQPLSSSSSSVNSSVPLNAAWYERTLWSQPKSGYAHKDGRANPLRYPGTKNDEKNGNTKVGDNDHGKGVVESGTSDNDTDTNRDSVSVPIDGSRSDCNNNRIIEKSSNVTIVSGATGASSKRDNNGNVGSDDKNSKNGVRNTNVVKRNENSTTSNDELCKGRGHNFRPNDDIDDDSNAAKSKAVAKSATASAKPVAINGRVNEQKERETSPPCQPSRLLLTIGTRYTLTLFETEYCRRIGQERVAANKKAGTNNHRYTIRGDTDISVQGVVGELAFSRLCGIDGIDEALSDTKVRCVYNDTFDATLPGGIRCDVKTTAGDGSQLYVSAHKRVNPPELYVLCRLENPKSLTRGSQTASLPIEPPSVVFLGVAASSHVFLPRNRKTWRNYITNESSTYYVIDADALVDLDLDSPVVSSL